MSAPGSGRSWYETTRLARLADATKALVTDAIYIFACLVVVVIVFNAGLQIFGASFSIQPISVPENFAQRGMTSEAAAARLRDEMGRIASASWMGGEQNVVRSVDERNSALEVNVLGTGVSVSYVSDALRDMLHVRYQKLSGELTLASERPAAGPSPCAEEGASPDPSATVRLVLRESRIPAPLFDGQGPYDCVMKQAALAALKVVSPYAAAIFVSRHLGSYAEALALVDTAEENDKDDDRRHRIRQFLLRLLWPWPDNDEAHGELARGYVLIDKGDYRQAKLAFTNADADFHGRSRLIEALVGKTQWYAAIDGLAFTALHETDRASNAADAATAYKEAVRFADAASKLNEDYGSARYHRAQADDERARSYFIDGDPNDLCDGLFFAQRAATGYEDLTHRDPTFGVAYAQEAILLAKEFHFLSASNLRGANRCAADPPNKNKIGPLFEQAAAKDPRYQNAWYEWGLFLYQGQWPDADGGPGADLGAARRDEAIGVTRTAIMNYRTAISLLDADPHEKPQNAYVWLRAAQAEQKLAALLSAPDPGAEATDAGDRVREAADARAKMKADYETYKRLRAAIADNGRAVAVTGAENIEQAIAGAIDRALRAPAADAKAGERARTARPLARSTPPGFRKSRRTGCFHATNMLVTDEARPPGILSAGERTSYGATQG